MTRTRRRSESTPDPSGAIDRLRRLLTTAEPPVLVVSTAVGRGMFTLGEAIAELIEPAELAGHVAIEDLLPRSAVVEDLERYRFISSRIPILLHLPYRVPLIYQRKLLRERYTRGIDLSRLAERIAAAAARTILCVSHRPAFWVSSLKRRVRHSFAVWGVLGEYGRSLGWKYIFWDAVDAFLTPVAPAILADSVPRRPGFLHQMELPARGVFRDLATRPGNSRSVLVACGYWGQGPFLRVVRELLAADPTMEVNVVCGDNRRSLAEVSSAFREVAGVHVHGVVPSLAPLIEQSGSVVTKPGISTLLEVSAAGRKIFLLRGMPVAEDHNAAHALAHFGAEPFTRERFSAWLGRASAAEAP